MKEINLEVLMATVEDNETTLYDWGFCVSCGEQQDGCEIDTRNYECENCGESQLFRAEEVLFMSIRNNSRKGEKK
jgi:predicted RNA-binding Zn-ribbon protein involved in translation (DUF1610 family)